MMWMMALGCLLPLALILILGGTGLSKNWIWLIVIAAMFGMHAMMMSGHGHSEDQEKRENKQEPVKTIEATEVHKHN